MLRSRWLPLLAVVPVLLPLLIWAAGTLVHSSACPTWCLTCTNTCPVAGYDLSWLIAWGILSPYLLLLAAPLSGVLLVIIFVRRRRAVVAT